MNNFYKVMALRAITHSIFLVLLVSFSALVAAQNSISLEDAIKATLQHNPQLAGYVFRKKALEGEQQTAALTPQFRASAQLENVAGTGGFKGVDAGEFTLSLSSIIELGGQRDARLGVVTARQQQLESAQRVQTLDVLAQVTRQFIALAASQEQLVLLRQARDLAQQTATSLHKQVQAGRTPEAELLRAKAAVARATIAVQNAEQLLTSERLKLSVFWAPNATPNGTPDFTHVKADLFALPTPKPLAELLASLDKNPDLMLLTDEVHVRAAEMQKAQAERKPNLEWNAGIRRLQVSDDSALVLGMSMPFGAGARASGAMATASANQAGAEQYRDSKKIQLHAQLLSVYAAQTQAQAEVNTLRAEVLPLLTQAMRATTDGFNQGRYSYLELNLAQRELLETQLALIDVAARAQVLNTELERITAGFNRERTGDE
jgi:outer membrane protein, heavy metal efflux system